MKFCVQCGTQIADNAQFCPRCGTKAATLDFEGVSQTHAGSECVSPPAAPVDRVVPLASANAVGAYFKKAATSPLFIIFAIVYSVYLIINLSMLIDPLSLLEGDILDQLQNRYPNVNFTEALEDYLRTVLFIGLIPTILILVGIWMTFFSARNSTQLRNGKGISLIAGLYKVLRVIYPIILALLSCSIFFACSAINDVAKDHLSISDVARAANDAKAILAGAFIGMWIGGGFVIYYFGKIVKTLKSLSYSITHSTASADISMLVIVMAFIGGGLSIVSAINSDGIFIWGHLTNAAYQILAACILLTLREKVSHLAYLRQTTAAASGETGGGWECRNCYSSNPSSATVCVQCGFRKENAFGTGTSESSNWRCICGRDNPSYITTCSCGTSKYHS